MELLSVVALSVFFVGFAFLTDSTTGGKDVRIDGLIVHARILRGFAL